MTDQEITKALRESANGLMLPERFQSPSALVRTTARPQRRRRGRMAGIATGVFLLVATAGLTAAAQGGLLGRPKQAEADAGQVAEAVRKAEASGHEIGALSLSYPVRSPQMTDPYGPRKHPETGEVSLHTGVDFAAPAGEPVIAAADGLVAAVGAYPELGNVVVISHGKVNGQAVSTWYAYMGKSRVSVGQQVKRGDAIAVSGTSGGSTGPHVHFEVRLNGAPVNPMEWIGKP